MQAALTLVPVAVILAVHAYSLIFTWPLGHPVLNLGRVEGWGGVTKRTRPVPLSQTRNPSLFPQTRFQVPASSLSPGLQASASSLRTGLQDSSVLPQTQALGPEPSLTLQGSGLFP